MASYLVVVNNPDDIRNSVLIRLLGAKCENGRSQVRDSVDIFSVLALRVSTWVTYSPQDSVQRLLLYWVSSGRPSSLA
jgi:hypothetical protein